MSRFVFTLPDLGEGTVSADRRYVTLNVDTSVAKIDQLVNFPVTAVAGGRLISSADTQSFIQLPTVTVTPFPSAIASVLSNESCHAPEFTSNPVRFSPPAAVVRSVAFTDVVLPLMSRTTVSAPTDALSTRLTPLKLALLA